MQIAHLEVFLAVVREGSFNGAAKRLWIAPSRVTERIQQLERELRAPLFDRSGRHLQATQAGLALIPRAQAVVREIETIKTLFPDDDVPRIRIGVRTLPPDIRDQIQSKLRTAAGHAQITFLPLDSTTQVDLLLSGRLDGGFVWDVPPAPLKCTPILSEEFAVAVPATARYSGIEAIGPEDLAGLRLASILDPLTVPAGLTFFLEQLPLVDIVNPAIPHATYLLVSGGQHCAFVSRDADDHDSLSREQRKNILIKPLMPPAPAIQTYFAWHPDLEESPTFAPVLDQVRRMFPTQQMR